MSLPVDPSALAAEVPVDGSRDPLVVSAPADGRRLGTVPTCTPADVRAAVERARTAAADWADRPVAERAERLRAVGHTLLDRRGDLLDCVCAETGKSRRDAVEEVYDAAETARYYADEGPGMLRTRRRAGMLPLLTRTTEAVEPLGVVGFITPWNYPLSLVLADALPALLAGNAAVVKADERTPLTALLLRRLLVDSGIPPGVFQVVTGDGATLGEPLVESVDGVGFTGSTAVGREVAALAGRHLVPASLELGGKNPLLVLPGTDPERAARGTVRAAFANAGQLCVATERVYVHADVADRYREALVAATRDLTLGVTPDWEPDVGSLLGAPQLRRTREHLADATERGATVLTGGRHRPEVGPYVFEPTVLTDVPPAATLTDEETFGPLLAVHEVGTVDEAVRRANDTDYGLHAAVYADDRTRGRAVADRLECGTVSVNDPYVAAWGSLDAPMGGWRDSGVGRRHGRQGLLRWTESRTVAVQRGVSTDPAWLSNRGWARAVGAYTRARLRLSEASVAVRRRLGRALGPGPCDRSGDLRDGNPDPDGDSDEDPDAGSGRSR